jgi:hypothetical protein
MSDPEQAERTGTGGSSDADTQPEDTGARPEPPKQKPDDAQRNQAEDPPA